MTPDKSLLVHVGGPRGAGKSSVLSLMTQNVTVGHGGIDGGVEALLARIKSEPVKKRPLNRRHIERERRGELSVAQHIAKETETPCHIVPNEQDTQYAA